MSRRGSIQLLDDRDVDAMAAAGRVVALALAAVRDRARVGCTLRQLDDVARSTILDHGAEPLFLGYHPAWAPSPFPGVICARVNDAVVHGPPNDAQLADGGRAAHVEHTVAVTAGGPRILTLP